jgi:UDP-N-acetylmuramyl tripeptide synthase
MRVAIGGVTAIVDYAHNPEGLAGLLAVAEGLRGTGAARGRLALLLGHAGNRLGADFEGVGAAAAAAAPDLVVVKENEGHIRGRASGEVTGLLRAALIGAGQAEATIEMAASEIEAVRRALAWAKSGDVLVLPVHALAARSATVALLEQLKASGWRAGESLA